MAACATQGTVLEAHAPQLQRDLAKRLRRFGRQCRGRGKVLVTLGRQPERPWLERGAQVLPLARAAQGPLHRAPQLSGDQRARLDTPFVAALAAQHPLASPSRRLTQGKAWRHCTSVNAYAPTMAPICTGKSNCPAQFGRTPGMIAEPAAGCMFALPLPVGNPSDASDVPPVVVKVEQAVARVGRRPIPAIHSLAGDLALHDATVREALHERGILTVGIPTTVEPLPPSPAPEDVSRILSEAGGQDIRTPTQVHRASACGSSRPVVESLMASLLCRGAGQLTDTGHRGALVQTGMAVLAHHAATLVRPHESRLSKRARTCRRRLRLSCRTVHHVNASRN